MGSAPTIVTPSPKSLPSTSPSTGEKPPNNLKRKKQLLDAIEAEAALLELYMQKKRQIMADKAVQAARAIPFPEHWPDNCTLDLNQYYKGYIV